MFQVSNERSQCYWTANRDFSSHHALLIQQTQAGSGWSRAFYVPRALLYFAACLPGRDVMSLVCVQSGK